jgi:4-amino-4-deoxy-L-arabinose transferase-like glycosyltransferase
VTLWIALAAFGLACLAINPLRETAVDDDWAYALTVKHLVDTGHYQLHDWAAPNLRFQAYWGGLFAWLLGYSQVSLRLSTLVQVLLGSLAFYGLAREHGLGPKPAGLLVFALLSSPLVLLYAFTFMTDAHFLMLLIAALWLYARALRQDSTRAMVLASLVACAAIFTRQFGIALVGGLVLTWALDPQRFRRVRFYLAGIGLPAAAGAVQIALGALSPNWAARWRMREQLHYVAQLGRLAAQSLWRPTVILQYLALFILPLALVGLATFFVSASRRDGSERAAGRPLWLLGLVALAIVLGLAYGQAVDPHYGLMPLLSNSFAVLTRSGPWSRLLITVMTSLGAVALGGMIVGRYRGPEGWLSLPAGQRLLDLVTVQLLALHLIYVDLCDEYLLIFLPFALIVLGRHLRPWWHRLGTTAVACCLAVLAVSVVWTRGILAEEEAMWQGGELALRQVSGEPRRVSASIPWDCFHGAFDDYLAEIRNDIPVRGLAGFFNRYLVKRAEAADYVVRSDRPGKPLEPGVVRIAEIPYRDLNLQRRVVYVERRRGSELSLLTGSPERPAAPAPRARSSSSGS